MAQATQCYYPCIDLAKFIFAFIIIGIHTSVFADYDLLDKLFAFITRFAVPFFFTASGFLYFQKPVTRTRWLHYIKRIGILYIIFSLLYFPIACSIFCFLIPSFMYLYEYPIPIAIIIKTSGAIKLMAIPFRYNK